eukprot:scaffold113130_cov31-Tisochrysis_lutea.AAC.4
MDYEQRTCDISPMRSAASQPLISSALATGGKRRSAHLLSIPCLSKRSNARNQMRGAFPPPSQTIGASVDTPPRTRQRQSSSTETAVLRGHREPRRIASVAAMEILPIQMRPISSSSKYCGG